MSSLEIRVNADLTPERRDPANTLASGSGTGARVKGRKWIWRAAPILLLWLLFAQMMAVARAASITFDEGPHLAVGYATLRTGDHRLQPVHIHPPLANFIAAAPLLLNPDLPDPSHISGWEIASLSAVTDEVVWQYPRPAQLALAGRLPIILLTLVTAAVVLRWATDFRGRAAGLLALTLYALDPNIVAHGSLITTDMAVTAFGLLAFFVLYRWRRRSTRARLLAVGLLVGLALASKVSAVLILALVEAIVLFSQWHVGWRRRLGAGLVIGMTAFVALWAVYGFELRAVPDFAGSFPLPAATHLEVYRSLQEHYHLGHPAFLMGQNDTQGWWAYFPVAFAVKTPLPTLILLGAALVVAIWRRRRVDVTLVLYPLIYGITALFSSVDIGYRHLLPMLPFAYVFVGSQLCGEGVAPDSTTLLQWGTRRVDLRSIFVAVMLLWLALGTVLVYPYPLTFFNELAGGAKGGYAWLVDSNLDWGQNLWQLRGWMENEGVERVYYSHYSPARPQVYDVNVDWLPPHPNALPFSEFDPDSGVYVIGATTLQGVYTPDVNTFAFFRGRSPDAVLGNALFVYRVPERLDPSWGAVCYGFPLNEQQIRTKVGWPDLRLVHYDCGMSQVFPAGGDGLFFLSPEAARPEGGSLALRGRQAGGQSAYDVVQSSRRPVPENTAASVNIDGPLVFLGYDLDGTHAQRGSEVLLRTYWRVGRTTDRPLSIMAHLVGTDGVPLAVGDGLGVPVENWQPGDMIVQEHLLSVPQDTPAGQYWLHSGAYWLDTMERWPVRDADGTVSDRLELTTVEVLD